MSNQNIKIRKRDLKVGNGIDDHLISICGNCKHYIWSYDGDRHKGDCSNKEDKDNCIYWMARLPNGLHALTGAKHCVAFDLDRELDQEINILVNKVV